MATSVADLAINVSANIAQAVEGMRTLGNSVSGATAQLKALDDVGRNFARGFATSLAGAFSVAAITNMVSSVVNAAASLDDLAEKTGSSVESLSRFHGVARITGQELGQVDASMGKLSKSLAEAQDGGSKAAAAFAAFGINIRDSSGNLRNSGEVMDDLARKQQTFGDGAGKSAAMMQLLGRSGAELIPFLNDYVRLSDEVSETTADQAAQAEALNIQIGLLQEGFNKLVRDAILPLIPQIREVVSSFASLGKAVADLSPSGRGPLEGFLASIRETNRQTIGELAFLVQAWEDARKWFREKPLIEFGRRDQQNLGQNFKDLFAGASAARETAMLTSANQELAKATRELPPLMEATATTTGKAALQFNAGSKGVDVFARALGAMQKVLRQAETDAANLGRATGDQLAPSLQRLADIMASPDWAKFSATQKDQVTRMAENAAGVWRLVEAYQAQQKVEQDLIRIRERTSAIQQRELEGLNNYTDSLADTLQRLREEGEEIGASTSKLTALTLARMDAVIARKEEVLFMYKNIEGMGKEIAALESQLALLRQIREQTGNNAAARAQVEVAEATADAWAKTFEDITSAGASFIEDLVTNGSDAFENLWENFKRWALQAFAKIAAQEIVVNLVGSISGAGGSTISGLLGGGGGGIGDILGGLLGGGGGGGGGILGGLLGGIGQSVSSGLFSLLGGAGTSQAALLAAQTAGFGTAGVTATLSALGGAGGLFAGATSAVLAALPVVGWIAAAGAAIYSIFGDDSVPKTGGSGGRGINLGSGEQWAIERRMFTPNDQDAPIQKLVNTITTDFGKIANALGANSGGFGFMLGYDAHEEYGNRVSALVQDASGKTLYEATDVDAGEDIEGALSLQAQRAILAALQAADMPKYLSDVFDSISAADASSEDIQGVIEFAQGLKIVVDAVGTLGTQFAAISPEDVQGFVEAFGGLEGMIEGLSFVGANFYTDAQKLEQATAQLNGVFGNLKIAVPETHAAFLELLEGLDLTVQADRDLYASLIAVAPLWVQVNGTAQDFADSLDDVGDSLDDVTDAAEDLVKTINSIDVGVIASKSQQLFEAIKANIEGLAGASDGTLGDQLTIKLRATQGEIERVGAAMYSLFESGMGGTSEWQKLNDVMRRLTDYQNTAGATLARFTVLAAQYDAQKAAELVNLEAWYAEQKKLFTNNSEAMDALNEIFGEKWAAIIAGVSTGVGGTIEELERLRMGLAEWLKGLTVGDMSPLKPLERLEEAQRQFGARLEQAQGGDKAALGDITKYADQYLKIARDLYKSSETYTGIFDFVTQMIADLAGTDQTGMPAPAALSPPDGLGGTDGGLGALSAAMPANGQRLASSEDMRAYLKAMEGAFEAALGAHANANSEEAELIREELRGLRRTLDAKLELVK
jgi:uncharacterized protein YoxC